MKATELELDEVKTTVRERYSQIAESGQNCGGAPSCCGAIDRLTAIAETLGYSAAEIGSDVVALQPVPESLRKSSSTAAGACLIARRATAIVRHVHRPILAPTSDLRSPTSDL